MAEMKKTSPTTQTPSKRKPDLNTSEIRANTQETSAETSNGNTDKKKLKTARSNGNNCQSTLEQYTNSSSMSQTETKTMKDRFEALMTRTETMLSEWQTIKEKLQTVDFQIKELQTKHDNMDERVEELSQKEGETHSELSKLKITSNQTNAFQEQYMRNYNLRVYGLPESKDETPAQLENMLINFFQDKLGVPVKPDDIDVAHRLGKPSMIKPHVEPTTSTPKSGLGATPNPPDTEMEQDQVSSGDEDTTDTTQTHASSASGSQTSTQTRTIIIRFVRRKTKNLIVANRFKLKKKVGLNTVVIREDLTKFHHQLLAKAQDFGEKAWAKEGKIFMKFHGRIREVKCMSELI